MTISYLRASLCLLLAAALAAPQAIAAKGEVFGFTVVGVDCKECAGPILKALRGVPGVKSPKLDWKAGQASVEIGPDFDKTRIKQAIGKLGFAAVFPGEQPKDLTPLPPEELQKLDITAHDGSAAVDVAKLLAPGKLTVLDFHADWCSPCKLVEMRLHHLMQTRGGIALRRVNVGHWDNAAAKQATEEFRAEGLPYLRVYDAEGRFVKAVTGGFWEDILAAIDEAKR